MDIHHNARSCPHSRALMVDRVQRGDPVVQVAAELEVTQRTVYKWLARYRQHGLEGLRDRSSRPHRIPRQTAAPCVDQIVQLRHRRMVSAEIAARLGLARSTVARILSRRGLGRLKALESCPATSTLPERTSRAALAPGHQKAGPHHRNPPPPSLSGLGVCPCLRSMTLPAWPTWKSWLTNEKNRP